jgi:hypothetical protein
MSVKKSKVPKAAFGLVTQVLCIGLLGLCDVATSPAEVPLLAQTEDVDTWVSRNYERVLDAVLPLEEDKPKIREEIDWKVSVRIVPAVGREFGFFLVKGYGSWLKGIVRAPISGSIEEQLRDIKLRRPDDSVEAAIGRVLIRRWDLDLGDLEAMVELGERLRSLRIPVVRPNVYRLDGTSYEFHISTETSNGVYGAMSTPESYDPGHYPLVGWIEDARHELASITIVPHLSESLKSTDPKQRWRAAEALGAYKREPEEMAVLLLPSLKDPAATVRISAAKSLGKIKPKTEPTVVQLI